MERVHMEEEKAIAERIMRASDERPLRIVVDEKLPNGSFRILISRLKSGMSDDQKHDSSAWEEEEARYVDPEHLGELLPGKRVAKIAEGQVYEMKQGQSVDIYHDARERVKAKTAKLLVREGKSMRRASDERW